jgi:hypothetical protein
MTVIFLLFVAALFWILASVNQRSLYWKTRARAYRNPEANEPSDFAYAMQRGLFIVFGLIFTIGSIVVATALGWFTGNENQVRSAAEEAVEALNGDLVGGSSVGDRETGLFADQVEFEVQLAAHFRRALHRLDGRRRGPCLYRHHNGGRRNPRPRRRRRERSRRRRHVRTLHHAKRRRLRRIDPRPAAISCENELMIDTRRPGSPDPLQGPAAPPSRSPRLPGPAVTAALASRTLRHGSCHVSTDCARSRPPGC